MIYSPEGWCESNLGQCELANVQGEVMLGAWCCKLRTKRPRNTNAAWKSQVWVVVSTQLLFMFDFPDVLGK